MRQRSVYIGKTLESPSSSHINLVKRAIMQMQSLTRSAKVQLTNAREFIYICYTILGMEWVQMNIRLTQSALQAIRQLLAKDPSHRAIYVYLGGIACGGDGKASFSLVPVSEQQSEHKVTVDGILFEYDHLISFHTDHLLIDYPYGGEGDDVFLESFVITKDSKATG